jgi:hypothetical protein
MSSREAGKGSKPRPYSVSQEEFDNNWDNIFKKSKVNLPEYQLNKSTGEVESVPVLENEETWAQRVIDEESSVD